MSFVNFEEIRQLIDSAEPAGGRMRVYFRCAKTGRVVEATGSFPESVRRNFAQVAAGSTVRVLLAKLSAVIRQYTGIYIPLGGAVPAQTVPHGGSFASETDRQAAAIAAFQTVAEYPGKPVRNGRFNHIDGEWVFVE